MLPHINSQSADLAEIFASIQGEGIYVGVPQIFIRFNQCNLDCEYCDTPINQPGFSSLSLEAILDQIKRLYQPDLFHSFSLTGGEPLVYTSFLKRLIPELRSVIPAIYLETNGVLPDLLEEIIDQVSIIAMDIKLPSALGGQQYWQAHRRFLEVARKKEVFVKVIITQESTLKEWEKAVGLVSAISSGIPVILQPATTPAGELRVDMPRLFEWQRRAKRSIKDVRIVPQVHKMLEVR